MTRLLTSALLLLLAVSVSHAGETRTATMYKRPFCFCCDGHADHLRDNGYEVTVIQSEELSLLKKRHGVPQELEGCHTILVGDYVVEGHVPASIIDKLLEERPAIRGISLPGMPEGSPGMSGATTEPFEILEISDDGPKIYAKE